MVTAQPQARISSTSTMAQPQMAGDVVGMSSSLASELLFKSKGAVKPATVKSARSTSMGSGVSGAVFSASSLSSSRAKKVSANDGGLSGGVSAGGLMLSGSKYAGDSEVSNGGATGGSGTTHPGGPRRVNQDNKPSGPFDDPIGDAVWPLILAAAVYGVYRRKRSV